MLRVVAVILLAQVASLIHAAESDWLPVEKQVAEATRGSGVTVVHFWAPWCSNCKTELAKDGWSTFVDTNAEVKFIFVTTWNPDGDGRAMLESNGLGKQANFQLLAHPNGSRKSEDKMKTFLDLP